MKWNRPLPESSRLPLWFQIAERLKTAVRQGEFKPGDILPSETRLNEVFAVSRATSRAALNELENEGLIVRRSGKGSIVLRSRVDQPAEESSNFAEDMRRRGFKASYRTQSAGRLRANREVAEALEVKPNSLVFCSRRLLMADDAPIGLAISWLAPRLFRKVRHPTVEELTTGSLYTWLHRNCGITFDHAREYIEAAITDPAMAEALEVPAGAPLLIARRQSFDQSGKPAEYAVLHFRADRYRFQLEVSRERMGRP